MPHRQKLLGGNDPSVVDGLGRLTSVTEQDASTGNLTVTTSYTYDAVDNLTQISQGGQTRTFIYDALSRLTSETTPEEGTVTYTYTDFDAVLKRKHQARGVEAHYNYDGLNRLSKVWYTGLNGSDNPIDPRQPLPSTVAPTSDADIAYKTSAPGNGQVLSITDGQITGFSSSESYTYESLTGRLSSKTRVIDGNSYQTQYQYNGISQVTLMIYPSGKRVRMNYDSRGRVSGEDKVDGTGMALTNYVSSVGYNVAGQVTGMTLGSGVVESYSYSSDRLQLTRQMAVKGATTLMDLNYNYAATTGASGAGTTAGNSGQLMAIGNNPSSQPSAINQQNRTESFTYDNVARLKTASGWSTWSQTYSYDNENNLTSIAGTSPKTISVDPATNRILNVNSGPSYSYDAAGTLTNDGIHSYQYDAAGRLAKVDPGSGNEANYYYDFQNWRVKKVVGTGATAVSTYYIWEAGRVIAEYGSAPPQGSGGTKYYHADRLSTRMTTDSNGVVISTQDHLPFGEDVSSTGQPEKHRFTNYERDSETGTDYAVNRQYGANVGRFLQPDLVSATITVPQSVNRYAYAQNDPINSLDPDGLWPFFFPISWLPTLGWVNVKAEYGPIVLNSSIGPFGPGEVPDVAIDPSTTTPPQNPTKKEPCPPVPEHPKDADIDANIRRARQHRPSGPFTAYGDADWFRNMVKAKAPWDYKRLTPDLRYENFGNFNYGATGTAIGFGLVTLLSEAGKVQAVPEGGKPESWGYPAGRFFGKGKYPYGDEPKDAKQIEAGRNYYLRKFVLKDCQ